MAESKKTIKEKYQKSVRLKRYAYQFLTIFVSVFAAFALNNWNTQRRDHLTETKILHEINIGLQQDLKDMALNVDGHEDGLKAANYFRRLILGQPVGQDSLQTYFALKLLRDFISVQNLSGYETLKSKGLEIVRNDSLRSEIIALYENDYTSLRKVEEDYDELQFYKLYYHDFNSILTPHLVFNDKGYITGTEQPLRITEREKKILLNNLTQIGTNRRFALENYSMVEQKIKQLQDHLKKELKK